MKIILFLSVLLASSALADPIKLTTVQDNSVILLDGQWNENAGSQARIRIKGNQHIVAISFDTSAIVGKRIKKATLVCAKGNDEIRGVSISTIAAAWDEDQSSGSASGIPLGNDPLGKRGWGYPGARFPAVIGGNAFTLVQATPSKIVDGNYHWNVPVDMVHAMTIGAAFGLAIHEHDADYRRNPTIFSREQSAKAPALFVELDQTAEPAPAPPTNLRVINQDRDSAQISFTAPIEGFAYEVMVDRVPLGRHNIPMVDPGKPQVIDLRDLPTSGDSEPEHQITVVTVNRIGQRSLAVSTRFKIFRTLPIQTPKVSFLPRQQATIADVSVIPITDKYDQAGNAIGGLPLDYRDRNAIFDGKRVHLIAAAGEVIGFQVLLRGSGNASLGVTMSGPLRNARIDLMRAVHVPAEGRMIPDPLLPLIGELQLKPNQDQVVVADVFVPFDCPAGTCVGEIVVSDGRRVPIKIKVLPFALPKAASFTCEMNGYGLPDTVDQYNSLQQIAYDHRVHSNILHYSHNTAAPGSRKSNLDMRMKSGRRMDNKRYDNIQPGSTQGYWDEFAEAFGPYLDGSLFQDGHRGPIPAPGFYLTFHESWPLHCRAYFDGNLDAFQAFDEHPEYSQTYVNVLRDFARVASENGWTNAGFQVYFNNKGSLTETAKSPWILDEPSSYWDFRALNYYGDLTDQGRVGGDAVNIDFRTDVSRPEFCRGQLDGRSDLWIVSSWAFKNYRRLVTDRIENDSLKAWIYGTTNHVHQSNRNTVAWALDAWQHGATGVVPWQTVDKSGQALTKADQLGLFIFDKDAAGETVIRHSLRLKAYREVEQLIEYLNLVQAKRGWSPDQMRRFVGTYVNLDGRVDKTNDDDAGTASYQNVSPTGLETLRIAAAKLLVP